MPDEDRLMGPVGMYYGTAEGLRILPHANGALSNANARLVLHRSVHLRERDGVLAQDDELLLRWAIATNLGQGQGAGIRRAPAPRAGALRLLRGLAERRTAALVALTADGRVGVRALMLEPESVLLAGAGTGGVHDVGMELEPTYGWPILTGSTLKGVTREWAVQSGRPADEIVRIFGTPPEADQLTAGLVSFFDALPWKYGVEVSGQVLTPHTRGYRSDTSGDGPALPGEHINPVPIPFLAVQRGRFVAHVAGPEPLVDSAAQLLREAVEELGVGAKTASGYGYLIASEPTEADS